MDVTIRGNNGVHEAESRLWCVTLPEFHALLLTNDILSRPCYLAVVLYVCGFVVLGASLEKQLSIGAVIMGWGIAVVAIMINTVAVCGCFSLTEFVVIELNCHATDAYCNDCFPNRQVCSSSMCLQYRL
jgi:hypothetical protein